MDRPGKTFEIWVTLGLIAFYLALMPATQLWDWDEPLYGRTGIEMWRAHDLLLPRFNGAVFPDKPPLGYWFMGASAQVLGATELGVRLFSAPAMALATLVGNLAARPLVGLGAARRAQVVLGTTMLTAWLGAAAMLDAYMMLAMALAAWALVGLIQAPRAPLARQARWLALLWLGLSLGWLAKGPVVPVLIGAMGLGMLGFLRPAERPAWPTVAWAVLAWAAALGAFLLWLVPADRAAGGVLLEQGFGTHILGRALAPMEGHGGHGGWASYLANLPYYVPVILVFLAPWSLALPAVAGALRGEGLGGRRARVVLLSWFVPVFVLFTLAATKLPHYVFPAFAPLAIGLGWALGRPMSPRARRWGAGLAGLTLLAIGALAAWGAGRLGLWPLWLLAGLEGAAALGVVWLAGPGRFARGGLWAMAGLAVASILAIYWLGLRPIEPLIKLSRDVAAVLHRNVPDEMPLFMAGYTEPSLVFYADRPVDRPIIRLEPATAGLALAGLGEGALVVTASLWEALREAVAPALDGARIEELGRFSAWNLNAGGAFQTVLVLKWSRP